jgi:hypothetical protein
MQIYTIGQSSKRSVYSLEKKYLINYNRLVAEVIGKTRTRNKEKNGLNIISKNERVDILVLYDVHNLLKLVIE